MESKFRPHGNSYIVEFKTNMFHNIAKGLEILSSISSDAIISITEAAFIVSCINSIVHDDQLSLIDLGWQKLDDDVWALLI